MATEGPGAASAASLTSLPRYEDIPRIGDGLDPEQVRDAFDAYRRHAAQLQAQLRVLQVAGARPGVGAAVEATGHAVRMDALHLIRAAAEFADAIELDAQKASTTQLSRTEEEVSRRQRELQEREAEVERYRQESERQRADALNTARREARELIAKASSDATRELQEAEARGAKLLEQSVDDPALGDLYREHLAETRGHTRLVEGRLAALGGDASSVKDAAMRAGALSWATFFEAHPDTPGKLAAFAYAFEHLEIAAYEELKRVAGRAGDTDTVRAADDILAQERAAAAKIEAAFDRAVDAALIG